MVRSALKLLYHSPESLLTSLEMKLKVLKLLSLLLGEAIEALTAFYLDNAIWKFDPHVGETSCQIRAYRILFLKMDKNWCVRDINKKIETFKSAREKIVQIITGLNSFPKYSKEVSSHQKLGSFLNENGLMFAACCDINFIVQSYVLTKFKKEDANGVSYIDYIELCQNFDVPRKLGKKLIHDYQVKLANDSVGFVERLLKKLPKQMYLFPLLERLKNTDDDNRAVLPCYLGMKILLSNNFDVKIPLLIVAKDEGLFDNPHEILLFFEPDEVKNDFVLVTNKRWHDDFLSGPCIVVYGTVKGMMLKNNFNKAKYINNFRDVGLANVLLSNMANHPQYSGNKLNALSLNPIKELYNLFTAKNNGSINYGKEFFSAKTFEKEFLSMKKIADTIGCTNNNASLFFIKHIFCDTLRHQLLTLNKLFVDNYLAYRDMEEAHCYGLEKEQYAEY